MTVDNAYKQLSKEITMSRPYKRKSIQPTLIIDTECLPIVRLWILRLLVPLGVQKDMINDDGFRDQMIANAIGLKSTCGLTGKKIDRLIIRETLQQLHRECENQHPVPSVPECLASNIERLTKIVPLSKLDCRIIEFAVLLHSEGMLSDVAENLGSLTTHKTFRVLSILLNLPEQDIRNAFNGQGTLAKSGLVLIDRRSTYQFRSKIELLSESFSDLMLSSEIDLSTILRSRVTQTSKTSLKIESYSHIQNTLDIMLPYLANSLETKRVGVNIFVHGAPGTGKSELARLIAQEAGCELYEVASQDENDEPLKGRERLRSLIAAQSIFSKSRALILFDETEDIFNDSSFASKSTAQTHKAWVNRSLELNPVPTIWLSNSGRIDPAFVRRFDIFFELPLPTKQQRKRILINSCGDLLDMATVDRISESEYLSPAVITRAASVGTSIKNQIDSETMPGIIQHLISNTLKGQRHRVIKQNDPNRLPDIYDPAFIHADVDMISVVSGLESSKSGRVCLYGPPGTGKTAFGRWLSEQLNTNLLVKRGSDLISRFVGGTEENIADAFQEADQEKAILLIDEVDSFLQDRRGAQRSWEVTGVNEMLTQMESFSGIFIASTNLMESLDQAALRRFDLKVRFDYLKLEQVWQLFLSYCESFRLPLPNNKLEALVSRLTKLTPGDFAAVARQHKFRPILATDEFVEALKRECAVKENGNRVSIGFH